MIKTSELTGQQLDWAVAKCEGNEIAIRKGYLWIPTECYSTEWAQGGPIMEREKIGPVWAKLWNKWFVTDKRNAAVMYLGSTMLVAAMRCYVASKLGDEVDIPDQLTKRGTKNG